MKDSDIKKRPRGFVGQGLAAPKPYSVTVVIDDLTVGVARINSSRYGSNEFPQIRLLVTETLFHELMIEGKRLIRLYDLGVLRTQFFQSREFSGDSEAQSSRASFRIVE